VPTSFLNLAVVGVGKLGELHAKLLRELSVGRNGIRFPGVFDDVFDVLFLDKRNFEAGNSRPENPRTHLFLKKSGFARVKVS
jgi:hypothetical protein